MTPPFLVHGAMNHKGAPPFCTDLVLAREPF